MSGSRKDTGRTKTGKLERGMNRPHRKSIGKRKKFENVCASKTCYADTAMSKPSKVDVMAINSTASNIMPQFIAPRFTKKAAKMTGTKALKMPKILLKMN